MGSISSMHHSLPIRTDERFVVLTFGQIDVTDSIFHTYDTEIVSVCHSRLFFPFEEARWKRIVLHYASPRSYIPRYGSKIEFQNRNNFKLIIYYFNDVFRFVENTVFLFERIMSHLHRWVRLVSCSYSIKIRRHTYIPYVLSLCPNKTLGYIWLHIFNFLHFFTYAYYFGPTDVFAALSV